MYTLASMGLATPLTQKVTSTLSVGSGIGENRVRIDECRIWFYLYDRCRASDAQKAQRLNRARELLRQFKERAQAVTELARECSISLRQAHRYIQQAQQLKQPIPVSEGKLAFTVKLPRSLIQRVRLYARARKLPVSEVVTRALRALVQRGRGRG